jgi:hypothetical protein
MQSKREQSDECRSTNAVEAAIRMNDESFMKPLPFDFGLRDERFALGSHRPEAASLREGGDDQENL